VRNCPFRASSEKYRNHRAQRERGLSLHSENKKSKTFGRAAWAPALERQHPKAQTSAKKLFTDLHPKDGIPEKLREIFALK